MAEHVGQLGAEGCVQVGGGAALRPGLARTRQIRLGQLADLLLQLQQEPRLVAPDVEHRRVPAGDLLDVVTEGPEVHAPERSYPVTAVISASATRSTPRPSTAAH